ncbi:MAG: ribosomal-processing cysteine protease Prp [Clostridia bacterium]|nr:ribosomal-processing cysteine protease Prp [Clostridia bacterium]
MTTVTVLYNGARIVGFRAKGHAGYAEHGEDIVCAAVSAITQTALIGITENIACPCRVDLSDGKLELIIDDSAESEKREKAELILGVMLSGLRSIESQYDNYLKVKKKEV